MCSFRTSEPTKMTKCVKLSDAECKLPSLSETKVVAPSPRVEFSWLNATVCGVLVRLGIETRLQLAITVCIIALVTATTLGGSGSATWVFILYRTLLPSITVLSVIGCWNQDTRLCRVYLACTSVLFGLMLVSVLRIQGSHFDGFYLWFKYVFFAAAFLPLAHYTRYQSARWKALLLGMSMRN